MNLLKDTVSLGDLALSDKKKYPRRVYGEECKGGCGKIGSFTTAGKCKDCLKVDCKRGCGRKFMCKDGVRICPKCRRLKTFPGGDYAIINSPVDR